MFGFGKWQRLVEAQSKTLKDAGDEIDSLNAENRKYLAEIVRLRGVAKDAGVSDEIIFEQRVK